MQNASNPLVSMYNTQLEASRRFAEAVFSGTEKIDRVMRGATQRAFNEQLNLVQAITTAGDPRSVGTTLQSNLFARNPDDAVNYQKEIVRIMAEMQNEISQSMQDYMDQMRSSTAVSAARPHHSGHGQANNTAFNPMTSMFSVWESAFKEVAELAKKNMVVARGAAEQAAGRSAQQAASYVDAVTTAAQEAMAHAVDQAARNATIATAEAEAAASTDDKRGSHSSGHGRKK
ncbi:phasin family protein [Noviherbaspirillum sp.]|uniref:phasin family protein n=1 Tax=Noviherbaspirillum sp. TaxID=1926288 RepID=UPI002D22FFD6|nr:phasin family protein [Noviherbaspirillum sp.]HZW21756.1 phasin family protein [Noviherbaspirillum sp.]